jgi:hypothetical protein
MSHLQRTFAVCRHFCHVVWWRHVVGWPVVSTAFTAFTYRPTSLLASKRALCFSLWQLHTFQCDNMLFKICRHKWSFKCTRIFVQIWRNVQFNSIFFFHLGTPCFLTPRATLYLTDFTLPEFTSKLNMPVWVSLETSLKACGRLCTVGMDATWLHFCHINIQTWPLCYVLHQRTSRTWGWFCLKLIWKRYPSSYLLLPTFSCFSEMSCFKIHIATIFMSCS